MIRSQPSSTILPFCSTISISILFSLHHPPCFIMTIFSFSLLRPYTGSPPITLRASDSPVAHTHTHTESVARKEYRGSSACCTGPESWQLWERTADPSYRGKESRHGGGGRGEERVVREMEWSNISAIKSPFNWTISSLVCSSIFCFSSCVWASAWRWHFIGWLCSVSYTITRPCSIVQHYFIFNLLHFVHLLH